LARRYLPARSAIVAAVVYALNPYHLITVYWDFRVAEMLASAVFPVAVMFALDCAEDFKASTGLALAVAAVWLMNAPAGVMLMYALSLLRSEEHTSELQSLAYLVCRLLLEKKKHRSRTPRSLRNRTP